MPRSLLKRKNYDIHAVGVSCRGRVNFNIVAWAMQTSMGGRHIAVALYKPDFTRELVQESGCFTLNFLATDQTRLIQKLGRKSGRETDKTKNLPFAFDAGGQPFLTEAVGYTCCQIIDWADGGDHDIAICQVLGQKILHPEKSMLTLDLLREKKMVRG